MVTLSKTIDTLSKTIEDKDEIIEKLTTHKESNEEKIKELEIIIAQSANAEKMVTLSNKIEEKDKIIGIKKDKIKTLRNWIYGSSIISVITILYLLWKYNIKKAPDA